MKGRRVQILRYLILTLPVMLLVLSASARDRRASAVTTAATQTQAVNETAADTSRINAAIRARSTSYVDDRGLTIYVDTLTNAEWTDSTLLGKVPKMEHQLLYSTSVGIDIWEPLMRIFGQDYGIAGVWGELNMHNRYIVMAEVGLGCAKHTGASGNYTYRSPLGVYFRVGANYNFLFNSNPDYQLYALIRYGMSPFSFSVDDVRDPSSYWGDSGTFNVPAQNAFVGWGEVGLGLKVKIWKSLCAGWSVKYRFIMHQNKLEYGKPWYIPGYGSRTAPLAASLSISYTFDLRGKKADEELPGTDVEAPVQEPSAP